MHDEVLDNEGVDLHVDEAVEMTGEDCNVISLGQQKDLFGSPKELLSYYRELK